MEESPALSVLTQTLHRSLEPYIRKVQDVTQIRRVLALHLQSQINATGEAPILHPLSLLEPGRQVGSTTGFRGLRREYSRCVGANIKARDEYKKVSKEHRTPTSLERNAGPRDGHGDTGNFLDSFLETVIYRRKHERLRILQDYVDTLAQKPAAASDYLDPGVVLKDVDSLPKVPLDVMASTQSHQEPQGADLNHLINQLEKSVLRAKVLLKREQKLLSRLKADGISWEASPGSRLQALGTTRNELINWIERELATAGESPADSDTQGPKSTDRKGKDYIDSHLSSIQRQYAQYIKARQSLITAATVSPGASASKATEDDTTMVAPKEESETTEAMSHVLQPYLEDLASISNQQKFAIQQKSHLTTTLSKQLKEAGQGLERLAEESHLLPLYPIAGSQRKTPENSFEDELSRLEKPDSSQRARAWVHASKLASKATQEAVTENLEEGEVAILNSHQTLWDLQYLLGEKLNAEKEGKDLWATVDGHLGVIKRGERGEV